MLLDTPRRDWVVEAFRKGARGVFCRCDPLKLLPKCVRTVYGGQIWANTEQIDCVFQAFAEAPVTRLVGADGELLLSAREQEVVRFVAEGLSNREIAVRLHLSEHTVKNYIFHIFNKLGISNRVELVLYAANQRLSSKLKTELLKGWRSARIQSRRVGFTAAGRRFATAKSQPGVSHNPIPAPLRTQPSAAAADSMKRITYDQVERASLGTLHLLDGVWRYRVKNYSLCGSGADRRHKRCQSHRFHVAGE
jgi:DNA-binding CsgD family transcriptional regulator